MPDGSDFMQNASEAYIQSMRGPIRNRGYIKGTIGIINSVAQNNATVDNGENDFTYFSNTKNLIQNANVTKIYATAEEDFTKTDGSMFFLPGNRSGQKYYNNGLVTNDLKGVIKFTFGSFISLDIKGLTIDFGEYYPTSFTISNGVTTREYTNASRMFVTEDTFDSTQYIEINPQSMITNNTRLRIYKISFGVVDAFGNYEVISCSMSEYVSATAETLPSKDVEIIIDNRDSYYNPDNIESAIGYLELGQEVKISFGYDINGTGEIEWMPETKTYLKSWSATDTQAQFSCTDLFDSMSSIYYRGEYTERGISLYDLAEDVLLDAGFDSDQYYLDSYLKNIIVQNPIPPVKHSEALQIIANAGRCALYDDRDGRIHIQSSFVPDMIASSNGEEDYSNVENILNANKKEWYAISSQDFSEVNGEMRFLPHSAAEYLNNTGYVSNVLSNADGFFDSNPKITISLESGFIAYGLQIKFKSVYPEEFIIKTYHNEVLVDNISVKQMSLIYEDSKRYNTFDKMVIEFVKNQKNSRVFVDYIKVGDVTDYHISRNHDLKGSPLSTRQDKLRIMTVDREIYSSNVTVINDLYSEDVEISPENLFHDVYLNDPAFDMSAIVEDNNTITAEIIESSSYYAKVKFNGVTDPVTINLKISGKEYLVESNKYSVKHNDNGVDKEWNNPLVSSVQHAADLEEWLSSYYMGLVDYQFDWRGDPRVDANDLFYFELKDGRETMIRAYENYISFNGAWSGKVKAREVVM